MPPKPTGSAFWSHGRWFVRVRLSPTDRRAFGLPQTLDEHAEADAHARAGIVAQTAARLRDVTAPVDLVGKLLERIASADGKPFADALAAAEAVIRVREGGGDVKPKAPPLPAGPTFKQIGERWTSGDLARVHPDHIKPKISADTDRQRLGKHIYPTVGGIPIAAFVLDDAERVMAKLPSD